MESVVSDTTSLIVLKKKKRLDLLAACFERVLLPDAVYREWLAGDPSIKQEVRRLGFFRVVGVDSSGLLTELQALLDQGEAEALALAHDRGLTLLVDEKKGRSVARMIGVPVLGLVGVLLLAVQREVLAPETAREILWQAKEDGFRLSDGLYRSFLAYLGLS